MRRLRGQQHWAEACLCTAPGSHPPTHMHMHVRAHTSVRSVHTMHAHLMVPSVRLRLLGSKQCVVVAPHARLVCSTQAPSNYRQRTFLALTKVDKVGLTNVQEVLNIVSGAKQYGIDHTVPVSRDDTFLQVRPTAHGRCKCMGGSMMRPSPTNTHITPTPPHPTPNHPHICAHTGFGPRHFAADRWLPRPGGAAQGSAGQGGHGAPRQHPQKGRSHAAQAAPCGWHPCVA